MSIPKSIDIFGEKYKIKQVHKPKCDGDETDGYINFDEKIIYVEKSLEPVKMISTIVHEALHGLYKRLGWNEELDDREEHIYVVCLEKFIMELREKGL